MWVWVEVVLWVVKGRCLLPVPWVIGLRTWVHAIWLAGDLTGAAISMHIQRERERAAGLCGGGLRIPRFRGSSRAARTAPRRTAGAHRGSTASWAGEGGRELLCGIVCMRVELERCGRAMMAPGALSHAKGGAGELRLRPMAWTTVTCGRHHRTFRNTIKTTAIVKRSPAGSILAFGQGLAFGSFAQSSAIPICTNVVSRGLKHLSC